MASILGLQTGYTKYCCFLCEWDSRARSEHYVVQNWSLRIGYVREWSQKNVKNGPLVPPEKIILLPLHIKFGLIKNKNGPGFQFLKKIP